MFRSKKRRQVTALQIDINPENNILKITINDKNEDTIESVSAGETINRTIDNIITRVDSGNKYVIAKDEIVINYDSTITGKVQYGVADIVGNEA